MTVLLASTTSKIQLITSAAGTIHVLTGWYDGVASSGLFSGGSAAAFIISTATTTDIVPVPGASTIRNVRQINVRNAHASNSNTVTVQWTDGTTTVELYKVVLGAGELLAFVEGMGWLVYNSDGTFKAQSPKVLFKALTADDAGGQNVLTAQPWFPTAGSVSVQAATSYFFEGLLRTTRAAGVTSHTTGLLFGGTATLTSIDYLAEARTGDVNTAPGTGDLKLHVQVATNTQIKAASTSATEDTLLVVNGIVRINAAGTFIPQFIYSAAPGGAPTIKRGTFFRMWPIGDNNIASIGTWA